MTTRAWTNEIIICYAPVKIYTLNVSVMEMVCVSVCITTIIHSTRETKHRGKTKWKINLIRRLICLPIALQHPAARRHFLCPGFRYLRSCSADAIQKYIKSQHLPWTSAKLSDTNSVSNKTHDYYNILSITNFVHYSFVRNDMVPNNYWRRQKQKSQN